MCYNRSYDSMWTFNIHRFTLFLNPQQEDLSAQDTINIGYNKTSRSNPANAVAQDRWSLITGCTQNRVGKEMNVYTDVCIIYTGRHALY